MTDTGHIGEAIAAKYYQQRGWLLLNHNYRTRMGEIDLILYKDDILVFAEVKTRTGAMLDRPAAAAPTGTQPSALMWWKSPPPPRAGRYIAFPARLSAEKI